MTLYIFVGLIFIFVLFGRKPKTHVDGTFLLIVFVLILMGALRDYSVGTDTASYEAHSHEEGYGAFELMFWQIQVLLNQWELSYQYYMIFQVCIILTLFSLAIKKDSRFPFLSLFFFYFLTYYFMLSYNIVRQGMAVAICVLFVSLYNEKKKWWILALGSIIAFLFHSSGIVIILYYLIDKIKMTNKIRFLSALLLVITFVMPLVVDLSFLFNSAIDRLPILARYAIIADAANSAKQSSFSLGRLALNFLYIFILYAGNKKTQNDIYFKAILFGVVIYNVGSYSEVIGRLADYFIIGQIFYLPIFMQESRDKKVLSYLYAFAIFVFMFIANQGGIVPYELAPMKNFFR